MSSSESLESTGSSDSSLTESENSSASDSSNSSVSLSSNSDSSSTFRETYPVHPLSYVIKEALTFRDSWVFASVLLDLRTTDQSFINQYGPSVVDFGGTFGNTFIPQDLRRVVDELRVKKSFRRDSLAAAKGEAIDWQIEMVKRVEDVIWKARQNAVLAGNTVEAGTAI